VRSAPSSGLSINLSELVAASITAFEWNEEDHPRDEQGRFGEGGGGGPTHVAVTQREVRDALVDTWRENFKRNLGDYPERVAQAKANGEPTPEPEGTAQVMYWRDAMGYKQPVDRDQRLLDGFLRDDPKALASLRSDATRASKEYQAEAVRPEVVANMLEGIRAFDANPYTAGLKERYGMPRVMLAATTPGRSLDDGNTPSGSYSPGERTIRMYENAFERAGAPEPALWGPLKDRPATISGGTKEGVLTHEYGHFIHEQIERKDGVMTPEGKEWNAIYDRRSEKWQADQKAIAAMPDQMDRIRAQQEVPYPVSYYSVESGRGQHGNRQEGFAETFAAVMHPDYDRNNYDPSNHEMLAFMERIRDGK